MTDNPLTGKVGLDVGEFRSGIAELNRSIRVIESGFRATAAGLDDWASSATGLETRIRALNGEIALQRSKVAALEGEYKRVAAEKGETSKAAMDLQIRLNKENETLNKMQSELGQTERALAEMGDESRDAAKGADQLGKEEVQAVSATDRLKGALERLNGRLQSVNSRIKAMAGTLLKGFAVGLAGIGVAAIGAAVGIGRLVTGAAKAADEIVESAEKIGITTDKYQEFSFIGEQVGTDVETIGRAFARTTKAISGADEEGTAMAKTLQGLGIAVRDSNGDLRGTEDVFGDIINALGGMTNETQRDIVAQQIFGKSYQELIPLINLGADGLAEMTKEAHDMGAVMGEDAVTGLADFNDQMTAMKAGLRGLMGRFLAPLIPLVTKIVDKFQDWLASPAVQDGIKRITDGIGRFADKLDEVIDKLLSGDIKGALSEIIPPETVEQLSSFAKTFNDFINNQLIPFIKEHGPLIKQILGAIVVGFAAFSIISTIVGWITGLVTTIGTLSAAFTAAGGGIAGIVAILGGPLTLIIAALVAAVVALYLAWQNNWFGIRDTLTKFWVETAMPIFNQIREWLAVNIPIAIEALKEFWLNVLLPAIQKFWAWCTGTLFPFLQELWNWLKPKLGEALTALGIYWTETLWPAIKKVWEWCTSTLFPFLSELWDWLSVKLTEALKKLGQYWTETLWPAIKKVWAWMDGTLFPFIKDLNDFLGNIFTKSLEALKIAWELLKPAIEAVWKFLKEDLWPIVQDVNDFIGDVFKATIDGLKGAFYGVRDAIIAVYNWLVELWNKIKSIDLPDWMTPGSPTPWEMGLRGVADAMDELSRKQMPEFAMATGKLGSGGGGRVTNDSRRTISIYGGLYLTGVSDADSLLEEFARLMP